MRIICCIVAHYIQIVFNHINNVINNNTNTGTISTKWLLCFFLYIILTFHSDTTFTWVLLIQHKVHSRWIFPAKLLSRCKPAPSFPVIFTLSCFIRDRAIESDLTSLILNVSLPCEIKSQIF
jgi:hypothetical protein